MFFPPLILVNNGSLEMFLNKTEYPRKEHADLVGSDEIIALLNG